MIQREFLAYFWIGSTAVFVKYIKNDRDYMQKIIIYSSSLCMQALLEGLLYDCGAEVCVATSRQNLFERCAAERFDKVVVGDISLFAPCEMASFVDSLVAPLSLINALIVAIGMRRREDISETFSVLEDIWDEYEIYEKSDQGS